MLAKAESTGWDRLLEAYSPIKGRSDELVDDTGRVRPHWIPVLAELGRAAPQTLQGRFDEADRHLRNSGVSFRLYDSPDGSERPWPLAHVPLVLSSADWKRIEAGIIQRATLLQRILADLYGPANLVRDGALPATVIAGNPDFLRPLVGLTPRGGEHLLVYGADLGRAPDGRWWVLGDRTQAPSGMGYSVENRLAISGALASLYRDMHIERLAHFFQALRTGLAARSGREMARIGLLTPGPANETYFEHAYLARYLGLLLVEGGDLTVQDGIAYVRTIEGPKRIDVLLRRLDASFADPLELTASSKIGVPGLIQAVRTGSVALANSLGAGLVEARAMLAFIPALSRRILGEDLLLPNVATWWCGDEGARQEVMARLGGLRIAPASSRRVPGLPPEGMPCPDEDGRTGFAELIATHPLELVGQEMLKLSTMPVWTGATLEPRPFTLRVFAVSTPAGWKVMHGGFCRVAEADDGSFAIQRGGRSADVWVRSDDPVENVTLLPTPAHIPIRRRIGSLPSRAADNLFWLGRYLERTEATLRVVRALAEINLDVGDEAGEPSHRLSSLLVHWGATEHDEIKGEVEDIVREAMEGDSNGSVPVLVRAASRTASVIRERLSTDATRAFDDLRAIIASEREADLAERADSALRVLAALSGLAQENMNRISGWRFLQIGRRVERAILTCRMVSAMADPTSSETTLDSLLRVTDSRITYRSRYLLGTLRAPVIDLVVLDDGNPRSVAFQIVRAAEHMSVLPGSTNEGEIDPPGKSIRILRTTLETSEPGDVDDKMLGMLLSRLLRLSDELTARYFGQGQPLNEIIEGLG
jgi:uncharacterized circularly permuted ATP-grasp superfamily protein/uncharacterized alpha-E superfamily protein